MEKVKAKILGKEYYLKVDDTQRLDRLILKLEQQVRELKDALKSKSENEILTLVALNNLDDADKNVSATSTDKTAPDTENAEEMRLKLEQAQKKIDELSDEITSAQSEMLQLAKVKEEENDRLRNEIIDYEQSFEQLGKQVEAQSATGDESPEVEKLRKTLVGFEKNYDEYVKLRQSEINKLTQENEALKAQNATLTDENKKLTDENERLCKENKQLNSDLAELLS